MGEWKGTCGLTNLPISADEPVVALIMRKSQLGFNVCACYPDNNAKMLFLPFRGRYNELGGIYDAQIPDFTEYALHHSDIVYQNGEPVQNESTQDILNSIAEGCCYQNYLGKQMPLYMMLFHEEAFNIVCNDVGARIPFDKTMTLQNCWFNKLKPMTEKWAEALKSNDAYGQMNAFPVEIGCDIKKMFYPYCVSAQNDHMDANQFSRQLADYICFFIGFQLLRKGFGGLSGKGADSEELHLHLLLAQFVQTYYEHRKAYYASDSDFSDEELNNMFTEKLFFG